MSVGFAIFVVGCLLLVFLAVALLVRRRRARFLTERLARLCEAPAASADDLVAELARRGVRSLGVTGDVALASSGAGDIHDHCLRQGYDLYEARRIAARATEMGGDRAAIGRAELELQREWRGDG